MLDKNKREFKQLSDFIQEYRDINADNTYKPVAVGRYGIRLREDIYSKELAKDYSKNKLIYKDTLTVGMGSVQIDIGVLTDEVIYSVSPAYHTYKINGIDSAYLRYCLQCRNQDMFTRYAKRGSRQGKSVDLKRWLTYKIPVYDIELQLEIVERIEKALAIQAVYQSILDKLDELIKARFVEMFGDPEHNSKNWNVRKICEICEVGSSKRIYQSEQSQKGVPFFRIADLVNRMDKGTIECDLYIPEERFKELGEQGLVPKAGDILITARGTLGRCYIIQDNDKFYFQDGMITWLSKFREDITPLYISYLFEMEGFHKQIDSSQAGSTVAYLSIAMTKRLDVMVPPIEIQNEFSDFVTQVDKSKIIEIHTIPKGGVFNGNEFFVS